MWVEFVTHGMYLGKRRVYLNVQVRTAQEEYEGTRMKEEKKQDNSKKKKKQEREYYSLVRPFSWIFFLSFFLG